MKTKRYTEGQILSVLEEADKGASHVDLCRKHGMSTATLEAWLRKYNNVATLRSALYRKNEQLDELQEVAGLGSWELDLSTKTADWTRKEYLLLGYADGEVDAVPNNFLSRIHQDDRERAREALDRPFENVGEHYEAEFRLVMPDGQVRHVAERGQIIKDVDGNPIRFVGTTLDITRRKQAEEERENLRVQLAQAQKMESIGRLAGGVAHDYNNMLSVILGNAELALAEVSSPEPLRHYLQEILDAAHHSADVTRQLLIFAHKQTVSPQVIDLNSSVERMLIMLRRLMGENIELAWLPKTGLRPIRMDSSQADQVLANLCINARDAITSAGKITIETREVAFDEDYCAQHVDAVAGEFVMLAVSDNGSGMDDVTLARVFEPFFSTKEVGKGTGLGLSSVHGIVKQNNGFIRVHSEPGKGTTFRIFLPVCGEQIAESKKGDSLDVRDGQGKVILVVEDEVAVLSLAEAMLTALGYRVLAANTCADALDLAGKHGNEIALLVTDVVMPGTNGRDLAEQLLPFCPGLRCLYMSGHAADIITDGSALEGGVHFLQKPFSRNDLALTVRKALDSG